MSLFLFQDATNPNPKQISITSDFALADLADNYIAGEASDGVFPKHDLSENRDCTDEDQSLVNGKGGLNPESDACPQSFSKFSAARAMEVQMGLLSLLSSQVEEASSPPAAQPLLQPDRAAQSNPFPERRKRRNQRQGKRPSKAVRENAPSRGKPGKTSQKRHEEKVEKLERRNRGRCEKVQRPAFSVALGTHPVSTGWHGKLAPKDSQAALTLSWKNGSIIHQMKNMLLVPYTSHARSAPSFYLFIPSLLIQSQR